MATTLYNTGILASPPQFSSAATAQPNYAQSISRAYTNGVVWAGYYSTTVQHSNMIQTWSDNIWILRLFPATYSGPLGLPFSEDYGNLFSDLLDPLVVVNTYSFDVQFTGIELLGASSGFHVTQQNGSSLVQPPNPPLPNPLASAVPGAITIKHKGEYRFDAAAEIDSDISTIDALWRFKLVRSGFADTYYSIRFRASRFVLFDKLADWGDSPPTVEHSIDVDIFQSDYLLEQRTSSYEEDEDILTISGVYQIDGKTEYQKFWNLLHRSRHRKCAIPFYIEPMTSSIDCGGLDLVQVSNFRVSDLTFVGAELIRIDSAGVVESEVRKILSVDSMTNSILVESAFTNPLHPGRAEFFMVVLVGIVSASKVHQNDEHHTVNVTWESRT